MVARSTSLLRNQAGTREIRTYRGIPELKPRKMQVSIFRVNRILVQLRRASAKRKLPLRAVAGRLPRRRHGWLIAGPTPPVMRDCYEGSARALDVSALPCPVRRKISKISAVDQPISMIPFSAVIGPSKCHCSTGSTSP